MLLVFAGCGGAPVAPAQAGSPSISSEETPPSEAEIAQAQKRCGAADEVHAHDLGSGKSTEAFAPCGQSGARDYSAMVKVEPGLPGQRPARRGSPEVLVLRRCPPTPPPSFVVRWAVAASSSSPRARR
ncbi:MAG TPA: hypothetical protein VH044_09485, partial [Polyangiaceae bacterium]|nr:hypothetical protein [Polyangiaceae bacterium]